MPLISISIVCGVKTLHPFVIVSCDDSATLLSVQELVCAMGLSPPVQVSNSFCMQNTLDQGSVRWLDRPPTPPRRMFPSYPPNRTNS